MFDIHVVFSNTPGALAAFGTLLGQHGIGLEGGGVFCTPQESHAHFLVEDGHKAQQVLSQAGFDVRDVKKPLIRKLAQARRGSWAKLRGLLRKTALIYAFSTAITVTASSCSQMTICGLAT